MTSVDEPDPNALLTEARAGQKDSLGTLLELYRRHLHALAGAQLTSRLRMKVNPSDLVQETFLQATCHFDDFRGATAEELLAWLRSILRRCSLRMIHRQIHTRKRSILREVSLRYDDSGVPSAPSVAAGSLISPGSSPSSPARRREEAAWVMQRLAKLPARLREVLVLRNLEGLPFSEVARQMNRSPGAVRVLWLRALDRLRQESAEDNFP
jgi:RNA polymerase sigma-70 factor (subfamily 1)